VSGDRAHIDKQIDLGRPKQSQKFGERARRMAYREDCLHWCINCTAAAFAARSWGGATMTAWICRRRFGSPN